MVLTAKLENLKTIQKLIMEHQKIPDSLKKSLCLAAEEIFVNISSYAYGEETGTVDFTLEVTDQITMTFHDNGKPFNPLERKTDPDEYDLDTQIGGLGRLIAFDLVDDVSYEYKDQKNILTLIKNLALPAFNPT